MTTLADGVVNFTFSPPGGVPIGQFLTATATDATGTSEFSHTVTATVPEGTSADLGVTISGAPDPVTAGESLTYTINVTNIGPMRQPAGLADRARSRRHNVRLVHAGLRLERHRAGGRRLGLGRGNHGELGKRRLTADVHVCGDGERGVD